MQKCLLCHNVVIPNFEPIANSTNTIGRTRSAVEASVQLPDFVHFNHQPHLARRIDCSRCHGDVADGSSRTGPEADMNFSVSCHWKSNASDSCYTCHYDAHRGLGRDL